MIFYCHYNSVLNEISKISAQVENDNDELFVFEIPKEIALSLLSGETSPHQWFAQRNKSFSWELIKKDSYNADNINRADNSFLFQVKPGILTEETDLHVVFDNINNYIDVYVKITSLNTPEKQIELYLTNENDVSFLIQSFFVSVSKLRYDITQYDTSNVLHCRQRFTNTSKRTNLSLFTTRIFPNITMEIVNDNP